MPLFLLRHSKWMFRHCLSNSSANEFLSAITVGWLPYPPPPLVRCLPCLYFLFPFRVQKREWVSVLWRRCVPTFSVCRCWWKLGVRERFFRRHQKVFRRWICICCGVISGVAADSHCTVNLQRAPSSNANDCPSGEGTVPPPKKRSQNVRSNGSRKIGNWKMDTAGIIRISRYRFLNR